MPVFSSSCSAFGVPFRLSASSEPVLEAMLRAVPFATEVLDRATPGELVFSLTALRDGMVTLSGPEVLVIDQPLQAVLERLRSDLMIYVADNAPDLVFVHAGVVAWQGRALLLPGSSFAGKTTLVAEFVRAGALYLSDEYALLDSAGRVHSYPRDLQMRRPGRPEQIPVAAAALLGGAGLELPLASPIPVSHVLFANYHPAGEWRPLAVSPGMAVLEMLRHAIAVQRTPARVMTTLSRVMETASAWRSERGEATETVRIMLQHLEDRELG